LILEAAAMNRDMRKQLLELIDRLEAIKGIERGLHEMKSGKGKSLDQVDKEIRKKHRIPRGT
jgi:hypothetical protein